MKERSFSASGRRAVIEALPDVAYDLAVVGGGITGAGVARDAAMRGLRVALFERGDFASGTSSASSKLLHGGIRYLEKREFRLVWEALRERAAQCRLVPHLARPVQFLFPLYEGHPVSPFKLDMGLWLYDALAGFNNLGRHRRLNARTMQELEPRLRADGLRGGCGYYDAVTDDARLTLENVRSAWEHGADCLNYVEVEEVLEGNGRVTGVRISDRAEGAVGHSATVRARCVVNACGPWSDALRAQTGLRGRLLRPTKGVHLLLPRSLFSEPHAMVLTSPSDRRILFVIPWDGLTIVGTTDTDFDISQGRPRADAADVRYILDMLKAYFPSVRVTEADILATYAGLRPLIHEEKEGAPSSVSREHRIAEERPAFITVAGGKLTTYRLMAREVVDVAVRVLRRGGVSAGPCRTAREPVVSNPAEAVAQPAQSPADILEHLSRVYGPRAAQVGAIVRRCGAPFADRLTRHSPDIVAQALYAFESEMALHLDDALSRRTHALYAGITHDEAVRAADAIAPKLGWSVEKRRQELAHFDASLAAAHPPLDSVLT